MNYKSLLVALGLILIDYVVKKRFPVFYKKMEFPINVLLTVLVVLYCGLLVYADYKVLITTVSLGSKVGFTFYIALNIAVFAYFVISTWRKWLKERNK